MRVHAASLIKAVINEVRERESIRLLIEHMEADPHTLEDIGLTLDEFAALQWRAHKARGPLRRQWQRLTTGRKATLLGHAVRVPRTPVLRS